MRTSALTSPYCLKVLRFFIDNPNSIDTSSGIAAWTNLERSEVTRLLELLAKDGVLHAFRTPSTVGYALTENKKVLKTLGQLLKSANA